MRNVLERLRGGDLRSTGVANDVALEAIEDPSLVPILFKGMTAEEPVVRMRCADALEKATREHPELLQSCAAGLGSAYCIFICSNGKPCRNTTLFINIFAGTRFK